MMALYAKGKAKKKNNKTQANFFKISPKFYYQHYIIHGKYGDKWPLPAAFTLLSGKSFEVYNMMYIQLKMLAMS